MQSLHKQIARELQADPALQAQAGKLAGVQPSNGSHVIRTFQEIPDVLAMDVGSTEWIVDGIIPRASVTLVAGETGNYKSWLALALLRGIANGGMFLGRDCRHLPALYLDRENPLTVVRERLAILGIESLSDAKIWGGWLKDAPPAIGDSRLLEIARELRPLLFFDTLIRFHAADENSPTEMAPVMAELRALANAGATPLVLHHSGRAEGSRYRGSSDIAGGVDTAFSVTRDRGAGTLRLECFKSRYVEEFSITLRPDLTNRGDFVVTEAPQVTAERGDAEKLAELIRTTPGTSQERVVEMSGIPHGRARAILHRFDGKLWRSRPGAHNAKCFFPSETSVEITV